MPSVKILEKKKSIVKKLTNEIKESCAGVLVDYKGITVESDVKLRKELREANVDYSVIKNTILIRALNNLGYEKLNSKLKGTTALAISKQDRIIAAKILAKFAEENEFFKIKAGFLDNEILDASSIIDLAKLPSKEILIAKLLGSLNSPISGLVGVLSGVLRKLVYVINAIKETKEN